MQYSLTILIILSILIIGCSSGGSNSGGSTISYDGKTEKAVIDRSNSHIFLSSFIRFFREVHGATLVANEFLDEPEFFNLSPPIDSGCIDGAIDLIDRSSGGKANFEVLIDDCVSETIISGYNEVRSGSIKYVTSLSDASRFEMSTKSLSLKGEFDTVRITASTFSDFDEAGIKVAVIDSEQLQQQFMLKDFTVGMNEGEGAFFVGDYGQVDVTFNQEINTLTFSGANNTQLTFSYVDARTSNFEPIVVEGKLSLEGFNESSAVLESQIDKIGLLEYRMYFQNSAPQAPDEISVEVDRLGTITLGKDDFVDPDSDFLALDWKLVDHLESCAPSVSSDGDNRIIFSSECAGLFQILVDISDGRGGSATSLYSISVHSLPAILSEPVNIQVSQGESIDYKIITENSGIDGPFSFSLKYGPSGITISEDGHITGIPQSFASQKNQSFRAQVEIKGPSKTSLEYVNLTASGSEVLDLYTGGINCKNNKIEYLDINNDGVVNAVCEYAHSYAILGFDGDSVSVEYVEPRSFSNTWLQSITVTQFDTDPQKEIIVGFADKVIVIDGVTREVQQVLEMPESYSDISHDSAYNLLPSIDGKPGFVMQKFISVRSSFFYDSTSSDYIELPDSSGIEIIWQANYYPVSTQPEQLFNNLLSRRLLDGDQLGDIDGDGSLELISFLKDFTKEANLTIETLNLNTEKTLSYGPVIMPPDVKAGHFSVTRFGGQKSRVVYFPIATIKHEIKIFDFEGNNLLESYYSTLPQECSYWSSSIRVPQSDEGSLIIFNTDDPNGGEFCRFNIQQGFNQVPLTISVSEPVSDDEFRFLAPIVKSDGVETLSISRRDSSALDKILLSDSPIELERLSSVDLTSSVDLVYIPDEEKNTEGYLAVVSFNNAMFYDYETMTHISTTTDFPNPVRGFDVEISDVDGDGNKDFVLYDAREQTLIAYSIADGVELMKLDLPENIYNHDRNIHKSLLITNVDGNNQDEILVLKDSEESLYLGLYRIVGGALQHITDSVVPNIQPSYRTDNKSFTTGFSVQDVDGDGKLEVIVMQVSGLVVIDGSPRRSTQFAIFDDDLSLLSTFERESTTTVIPTIRKEHVSEKSNLLVYEAVSSVSSSIDRHFHHNVFTEIDLLTGEKIWSSRPFLGVLDPNGLRFEGADINSALKWGVFDTGVYEFK